MGGGSDTSVYGGRSRMLAVETGRVNVDDNRAVFFSFFK